MNATFALEITLEEIAAMGRMIGFMHGTGGAEHLERMYGEEFSVAYASLILKFARVEQQAVPGITNDEEDSLATFAADLDQRRAALAERRRREET
jgi:hypothetical protein